MKDLGLSGPGKLTIGNAGSGAMLEGNTHQVFVDAVSLMTNNSNIRYIYVFPGTYTFANQCDVTVSGSVF